jgi:hypothetical protein
MYIMMLFPSHGVSPNFVTENKIISMQGKINEHRTLEGNLKKINHMKGPGIDGRMLFK